MEPNPVNFRKVIVNYGLVIRADIDTIERLKNIIETTPSITVIFQMVDGGKLWIVREKERGEKT